MLSVLKVELLASRIYDVKLTPVCVSHDVDLVTNEQ